MPDARLPRTVGTPLLAGFTVATIGGPLALAGLYFPGAAGAALPSSGLTALVAVALFLLPLAVWLSFSRRVASAGGLAAFVEAAVGRRAAKVQAAVWTVSYFLYIPYTVTYVVYDVLPVVFPGIASDRWWLELLLPALVVGAVLLRLRVLLVVFLALALAQLALLLILAALEFRHAGGVASTFRTTPGARDLVRGGANVSLLFVCASLPVFLGGEAREATRGLTRALAGGFFAVAVYFVLAAIPLGRMPASLVGAEIPGLAIATAYSGRPLAVAVGLATAASIAALIVAEYVALSRLLFFFTGRSLRTIVVWIAVPFVAADAISLVDPDRFYTYLLKPSLAALFVSQALVFAAYPLYERRLGRPAPALAGAVTAAAVACGLMAYGFYMAVTSPFGGGT